MRKIRWYHRAALGMVVVLAGCAGDGASGRPVDPVAPEPPQLQAAGSLRNIHLSWTPSAGAAGYHIYRSTDGVDFARLTGDPVAATSYDDPIESPGGDGVRYHYRITAMGDLESAFSNTVRSMHGTRLAGYFPDGFDILAQGSPYVAEQVTTIGDQSGAGLRVAPGAKLYVLDGAVIDFEISPGRGPGFPDVFFVAGLIRATASAAAPARFTAHQRGGGVLADGAGFDFEFLGVPYDPSDGSGSLLDHVALENLGAYPPGRAHGSIIIAAGLKLRNVKLSGTHRDGSTRLAVQTGGWVILEDSYLDGVTISVVDDMRNTPFKVTRNVVRRALSIFFDSVALPAVSPGQIEGNDFDGTTAPGTELVTRNAPAPLGNNYWAGGGGSPPLPETSFEPAGTFDFSTPGPALLTEPAVGTDW